MSFDNDIDIMDSIEACRTCGVFFLTSSSFLRQIFTSAVDDPEMMHIRMELTSWSIEINENDGYPQFICTGCIHEFQKVFKFRRSCIEIQEQLRHFYNVRNQNQNKIKIKTELPDEVEENVCDFIYVDDLSDVEYDGATFNIPHVPIKEEIYEAATPEEPLVAMDTANANIESNIIEPPPNNIEKEIESAVIPLEGTEDNTLEEDSNVVRVEDEAEEADNEVTTSASTSFVKCEFCNCISPNMQQHKLHLKRVHETRDMECHICGKKFRNSSTTRLKFHLKWHKISKHVKCAQCGFYCSSREMLREHTRQMHSKLSCTICGKSVLQKRMKYHMRTHGLDTLFECTYCTQVFSTSSEVTAHISNTHTTEAIGGKRDIEVQNTCVEVACAVCDQKFINQVELKLHVQEQHLAEESNDFNKCMEEYPLMFSTNNPVSTENCNDFEPSYSVGNEEPVEIYCANCQQNFANQEELNRHAQQCPQIVENKSDEFFRNAYNDIESEYLEGYQNQQLIQQNNYSDDQSYTDAALSEDSVDKTTDINEVNNFSHLHNFGCAQCTDTFESVEQLRDHHDRMHSKKSNFNCHICGKVFELKFSLNRHLKKHDNV